MAQALNRRLLLPSSLRMRRCVDEELCRQAPCTPPSATRGSKQHYHCPLHHFLDPDLTAAQGGVVVDDVDAMMRERSSRVVDAAFQDVYDKANLWLDSIPASVQQDMDQGGTGKLTYYRYHLGCELSYFKVVQKQWPYASGNVHSFAEHFACLRIALIAGLIAMNWDAEGCVE